MSSMPPYRAHRHAGVPLARQPGRTRLNGDGAELMREHVVQLARETGPLGVMSQRGRRGGRVPVGRGDLTQAECRRQQCQRQRLLPEAIEVSSTTAAAITAAAVRTRAASRVRRPPQAPRPNAPAAVAAAAE